MGDSVSGLLYVTGQLNHLLISFFPARWGVLYHKCSSLGVLEETGYKIRYTPVVAHAAPPRWEVALSHRLSYCVSLIYDNLAGMRAVSDMSATYCTCALMFTLPCL